MKERRPMRVLLLVAEAWRCDSGGGNTLHHFLAGMNAEFAQVYCSAAPPQNGCCRRYYQITDAMAVRSFFTRKPAGRTLEPGDSAAPPPAEGELMRSLRRFRPDSLVLAKAVAWRFCRWRTDALRRFILDFNPNVILAPCYGFPFQLALTRYAKALTGKKVVTYSADDNYSLRQFSLSPFYWAGRLWNRRCLRRTYPCYDAFYSMSEDEIREMEPVVGQEMRILRKGVELPAGPPRPLSCRTPIRLVYAGGLYIGRWRTLAALAAALRDINRDGVRMELHIYTAGPLPARRRRLLHDGQSAFVHPPVSMDALREIYRQSHIAVHCEAFALRHRLATRLSFSTKIADCLASGCAVLAVAWREHTGMKYLKAQDAALCVTRIEELRRTLLRVCDEPALIARYARKARRCALQNHDIRAIQGELSRTLQQLAGFGEGDGP